MFSTLYLDGLNLIEVYGIEEEDHRRLVAGGRDQHLCSKILLAHVVDKMYIVSLVTRQVACNGTIRPSLLTR